MVGPSVHSLVQDFKNIIIIDFFNELLSKNVHIYVGTEEVHVKKFEFLTHFVEFSGPFPLPFF